MSRTWPNMRHWKLSPINYSSMQVTQHGRKTYLKLLKMCHSIIFWVCLLSALPLWWVLGSGTTNISTNSLRIDCMRYSRKLASKLSTIKKSAGFGLVCARLFVGSLVTGITLWLKEGIKAYGIYIFLIGVPACGLIPAFIVSC